MAYTMKKNCANRKNYGSARSAGAIKYIVIHYTANDGDTDEANGKYFHNNVVKASAHYFVDSDSVTQSVPDNYTAYSVGGSKYSSCSVTGGGKYYGKCVNGNSISIELCDDRKGGGIYPSAATIANAIALTKKLMRKYGVPQSRVIRHFDVNGKPCPAYWCGTAAKNATWKSAFWEKLGNNAADKSFCVRVTVDSLNIRTGAGTQYDAVGAITDKGTYTITAVKNGWGKLKSGAGWINIGTSYCKRV